ncbi:hypothetical protein OAQ99_01320, partial [Candidatus Kapabacteria bacterium]|nr:hypothetical protein [Candidatus Kapabacteria bacterium]
IMPKKDYIINEWFPFPINRENPPDDGYISNTFCGPGSAIRRRVFDKIGGFWQFGMEEIDFSSRCILAGFNIRYFPQIRILHYSSNSERDKTTRWLYINKQFLRYIWKYTPNFKAIYYSMWVLFTAVVEFFGMKVKISGLLHALFLFPETVIRTLRDERIKLSKSEYKKITLGISIAKSQRIYIKNRILHSFKRK